jgi:hypothetical protein
LRAGVAIGGGIVPDCARIDPVELAARIDCDDPALRVDCDGDGVFARPPGMWRWGLELRVLVRAVIGDDVCDSGREVALRGRGSPPDRASSCAG